jgi:hypothetical protein
MPRNVTSDFWLANTARLRELIDQGKTSGEISQLMGITRNAVIGRISRLGWRLARKPTHLGVRRSRRTGPPIPPGPFKRPSQKLNGYGEASARGAQNPATLSIRQTAGNQSGPPLSIIEIRDGQCRYPVTEDHPFMFCGRKTQFESSYCPEHHSICRVRTARQLLQAAQ